MRVLPSARLSGRLAKSTAGEEGAKVEFWLTAAQVVMALLLLGLMGSRGLLERDGFLSAYLSIAFLGGAILYVLARSAWGSFVFNGAFLTVNTLALWLASAVVGRTIGWFGSLLLAGALVIASAVIYRASEPMTFSRLFVGAVGAQFFLLGFMALCLASLAPLEFDRVKFGGLALFWMASGAAGVAYWNAAQTTAAVKALSGVAGLAGAVGCLFMAIFFSGLGAEPAGRVDVADTQQDTVAVDVSYRSKP